MSSLGAGLRALVNKKMVVQVEVVRGLTNPVAYETARFGAPCSAFGPSFEFLRRVRQRQVCGRASYS